MRKVGKYQTIARILASEYLSVERHPVLGLVTVGEAMSVLFVFTGGSFSFRI